MGKLKIHMQKIEVGPFQNITCIKINSKCIKDLNEKTNTIKLLKKPFEILSLHWIWQIYLGCITKSTDSKNKNG